jgi:signal transduction histidine kinase
VSSAALTAMQVANATAFVLIGLLSLFAWLRERERRRGYLALALGFLGLVALGVELEMIRGPVPPLTTAVIVCSAITGLALLAYRHSIVELPVWARTITAGGLVGAAAYSLAAGLPGVTGDLWLSPPQLAAFDILITAWCFAVVEPAYRLARLSGDLPPVQRARLRAIAGAYGGIVVVAALSLAAMALRGHQLALVLQVVALFCVPPLYVALAPPRWLRWAWRSSEEARLRRAIHEVLLATPDRSTVARGCLTWAVRLVGAEAGVVTDADGRVLAVQGVDDAAAREIVEQARLGSTSGLVTLRPSSLAAIVEPLPIETGRGLLIVVSGTLSTFGAEEVEWLTAYSASVAIALDRARVAELTVLREAELRRARDLAESASRAKSDFISRISHELRTPLTAIIGFADLLAMDEPDEQRADHLATILKAADHLLGLINDVLDGARIEQGSVAVSLQPMALAEVAAVAIDLARPMATHQEVTLVVGGLPVDLRVVADPQRLRQVLVNLVSNAVKYNRKGGSVEIGAVPAEGWSRITVKDTGPGLKPEEMARLFSPFERLSAATSGVEGTGLGLAVSRSLTEAMGGRIGVESSVGHGSTFWIELPLAETVATPETVTLSAVDGVHAVGRSWRGEPARSPVPSATPEPSAAEPAWAGASQVAI